MKEAGIPAARAPDTLMIDSVNWQVRAGDFWVIGGLPGSGKTGLLFTAAGLLRPLRGAQWLFGQEATQPGDERLLRERLRVGLVFEEGGRLFHHLTVAQNIGLPLQYHHNVAPEEIAEQVKQVLEMTGLTELAHSTPGRVARTWRQRIGLARALALKPELLLLDNPLAGLDPRQTRWWLELLEALSKGHSWLGGTRATLVVTSEDLRPWLGWANQFAVIKERRWFEVGGPEAVRSSNDACVLELMHAGIGA